MKLSEFIINSTEYNKDYISLLKFENYFKKLNNKKNFQFINFNNDFTFKDINLETEYIISCNPDCDFPPPKTYLLKQYPLNTSYAIELQNNFDNMNYYDKLQLKLLDEIPDSIKKIYCHAVGYDNNKVVMIPLGRDWKNEKLFNISDKFNKSNKSILCYYNCTLPPDLTHWYGLLRKYIYDICSHKKFIYTDNCNKHPRIYSEKINLNYLDNLAKSKFMICPRGCGIDSYRMWDCIFMGCIPIVEKYHGYRQFEDLPILFVNNSRDIENLTQDYLENKWNELLNKEYNYEKLTMNYWVKKIDLNIK